MSKHFLYAALLSLGIQLNGDSPAGAQTRLAPPGEIALYVNIPAGRMDVYVHGHIQSVYWVSVGSREYPTPAKDYEIGSVTWNPWWHPPRSAWAEGLLAQEPGEKNPMGRVKLHLEELLYIHGTSATSRLGGPASHGCIRLANRDALSLARFLQPWVAPHLAKAQVDALEADPRRTAQVTAARKILVRVEYRRAELHGEVLRLHPDVYERGGSLRAEVQRLLAHHGYDVQRIRSDVLLQWAAAASEKSVALSVRDLLQ